MDGEFIKQGAIQPMCQGFGIILSKRETPQGTITIRYNAEELSKYRFRIGFEDDSGHYFTTAAECNEYARMRGWRIRC